MHADFRRGDGRAPNHLRPIHFETDFTTWAEGSVLAQLTGPMFCGMSHLSRRSLPGSKGARSRAVG
jgi:ribonuclease PH